MKRGWNIDRIALHPIGGYIFFFFLLFIVFQGTFFLGAYPMEWIEAGVESIHNYLSQHMAEGPVKDLLIEGVLGGVGGVIVFLPNILLLFTFISVMESCGYMARAAKLMDGVMHRIGLSGHSFVPLIMGFGCNVPAILAAKEIEDHHSKMITIMVNPLMSCSARLPIYVLLAGAFFPEQAGLVIFGVYVLGILLAIGISAFLRTFVISTEDDTPLDLTLPAYRTPSVAETVENVWGKGLQYLRKMAGVIMLASVLIWFLGDYPTQGPLHEQFEKQKKEMADRTDLSDRERQAATTQITLLQEADQETNSYIGRIGRTVEPIFKPLGFNWKVTTSLLTGIAGKELIVSTLGVLYASTGDDSSNLSQNIMNAETVEGEKDFSPATALALIVFVLIYFPCLPTIVAIKNGTGKWKWSIYSILYTTGLAWTTAFVVRWIFS